MPVAPNVLTSMSASQNQISVPMDNAETLKAQCSKIGKKCNFKSAKKALFAFSKMAKKINFCTRKKFKTTKNAIFGLFSGAKIGFFAIFEKAKKGVFVLLKLHFFPILEHCALSEKNWSF